MLNPGEVGVCAEPMYAWAAPRQIPGTLYLTSQRLVFEITPAPNSALGLDSLMAVPPPPVAPMLNLDLRSISNVAAAAEPSGWHSLRVEAGGGASVYVFQTPSAQSWLASIQQARSGAPPAPPAPPLVPVPSAPAAGTIWCTRCGTPATSGSVHCTQCGSKLAPA
jgi:hypothetical protein